LMKDLWADLQAGDTKDDEAMMGWSLEQLERELAHLEDEGPETTQLPPQGMPSAASLVVSHAQERMAYAMPTAQPTVSAADAWSQSLQSFTVTLEQDFLAADSARKQTTTAVDEDLLRDVQDYNVSEVVTAHVPPGLAAAPFRPPGMPSPAKQAPLKKNVPDDIPAPPRAVKTLERDQETLEEDEGEVIPPVPGRVPPTPQNSVSFGDESKWVPPSSDEDPPIQAPVMVNPIMMQHHRVMQQPPMTNPPPKQQAWQSRPVQMSRPMPTTPVYCQPDPYAPPIPSVALESSLMKARDLAYVLHSMLKPILIAGASPDDYDILLWQRRSGRMQSPNPLAPSKKLETEMTSRSQRSKEWMAEHSTLGHVAKADASRPRALIAVHTATETSSAPNKERAILWKARLYVDQGYQAYHTVVQVWKAAPPGTVPREIQPHLVKLLKCLGLKLEAPPSTYSVDETALSLLLKLPKGQTLLARILEQALLPPKAVQALLPVALSVAIHSPLDEVRLFRSFATVITTLPNMEPTCLLESVKAVQHSDALSSTSRMECIHALLRRGNSLSTQDASFAPEWARTEQEFMKLLE
jgi:hypothetical protein